MYHLQQLRRLISKLQKFWQHQPAEGHSLSKPLHRNLKLENKLQSTGWQRQLGILKRDILLKETTVKRLILKNLPWKISSSYHTLMAHCLNMYHFQQLRQLISKLQKFWQHQPYFKLTPAQRFEIGEWASEQRVVVSIRYLEKIYPNLLLKETNVTRLIKLTYKINWSLRAPFLMAAVMRKNRKNRFQHCHLRKQGSH